MTAEETFIQFASKAIHKRWRDRYVSIATTKRGKKTILEDLWHQFEDRIDQATIIEDLPSEAWRSPAFSYSQTNGFGREEESVRKAFDTVGDGSLIIDKSGKYGIYQPEDMIDNIKKIKV
ncbi:hypothetical protein P4C99_21310 [Pontiellaceae bacterium B1224]|nr:hypothetical protein [Pontiellaceae bacterium B1224]